MKLLMLDAGQIRPLQLRLPCGRSGYNWTKKALKVRFSTSETIQINAI